MPRRRMIDPQIWRNEKVGSLPDAGRLLFIGIFSQADDDGRLKASPRFLMASIFPYDKDKTEDDVRNLRDRCAELGLIRVYSNSKEEYLNIPGWREHQQIRKDRYNASTLPSFEESKEVVATTRQPDDNQPSTTGRRSIVKSSLVKSNTPLLRKGAHTKQVDPLVNEIFIEMRTYLGYPKESGVGETLPAVKPDEKQVKDPIPNYGKEGMSIKRMLTRGFTREEIVACWKSKVSQRGGEFVSMTWVNEDIGKKEGRHEIKGQRVKGARPASDFSGRSW